MLRMNKSLKKLTVATILLSSLGLSPSITGNTQLTLVDAQEQTNVEYVNNIEYTVVQGDTLYSIAQAWGADSNIDKIMALNNLSSDWLYPGQVLLIPNPNSPTPGQPNRPLNDNEYVVGSNESIESIAAAFGVTAEAIIEENNLSSNNLGIGQIIRIPQPGNENPDPQPGQPENPDGSGQYTVKPGDTLWAIAAAYGVSVDDLMKVNNLSSDFLSVGQVIIIP